MGRIDDARLTFDRAVGASDEVRPSYQPAFFDINFERPPSASPG